jgi:hypothetical protein
MTSRRVLLVGLDGFEPSLAARLMAQGRLPALRGLVQRGATIALDHGAAKRSGLAWEHISTGKSPDDARRWAAVDFDPATYQAVQRTTDLTPFLAELRTPAVVFDAPYFDLKTAPNVEGLISWGAHDPGVPPFARPRTLRAEIDRRFGPYPASEFIYGFVWPSPERSKAMGDALIRAVDVRADITDYLFAERLGDWQLGLVVISEYHSAIEALWHGVDPAHPLHGHPSAPAARRGVEGVYEAGDRMLARLIARFPDTQIVAFNLHGMGANNSDVPSMLLLPELLYRDHFGRPFFETPDWPDRDGDLPLLGPDAGWESAVAKGFPAERDRAGQTSMPLRAYRKLVRSLGLAGPTRLPLDWMPAARYQPFWSAMPAFALPSFYDGRIRINLQGREANGRVAPDAYDAACSRLETLLLECTDPISGEPLVGEIVRAGKDARTLTDSEADLIILWHGSPLGLDHPRLGRIGPIPFRRTGGHTGGAGVAFFSDPRGLAEVSAMSAFDLVPTVLAMLGEQLPRLSGVSRWQVGQEKACRDAPLRQTVSQCLVPKTFRRSSTS